VKVLVACEFSGVVRRAFRAKGHDAISCDILPAEDGPTPYHYEGDVRDILDTGWDLIIAHPPCTYLSVSGNKHYSKRPDLYLPAVEFAKMFMDYAPRVCIENPIGRLSSNWRKPDQIVQPWMFGHEATKSTCFWLKGLPKLTPTNIVGKGGRHVTRSGKSLPQWYNLPPSKERSNIRSRTFDGIGEAMADQWSGSDTTLWGGLDVQDK
jgi:hypothetical protein